MPLLRPFRALRYDAASVGDLSAVISPPYDVIDPDLQARLLARHPRNSVRLDLPEGRPGDEPGARYRRAAADFVAWRSDGTLRKDPGPAVYVYEQRYRAAGASMAEPERVHRGVLTRLRLEDLGPGGGVLPHERTLSGPKEDRYQLLRATGANFSPIVGLYEGRGGRTPALLEALAADPPLADVLDDEGVRHRLWSAPVTDPRFTQAAQELLGLAGAGPITLADGHHRYETALRYRDERRQKRACPHDPPYEFVFSLLFDTATETLEVLPTHRLVRGGAAGEALLAAAGRLFRVERLDAPAGLLAAFGPGAPAADPNASRTGQRIGLFTGGLAAILRPDHAALAPLLDANASETLRWLPVNVLAATLERMTGLDAAALAAAGRLDYTKDARAAIAAVGAGTAEAAFLLDPISAATVRQVAEAGELMPQKSTYFWPKAPTGLLFSPGEW